MTVVRPLGFITAAQPYGPGDATGITLGSTPLVGGTNATVAGLTLSGPTLTGTTVLPGSGRITSSGSIGIGATPATLFDVFTANNEHVGFRNNTNAQLLFFSNGAGAFRPGLIDASYLQINGQGGGGVSIGFGGIDPGSGNLQVVGTTRTGVYTVATLPTAGIGGRRAFVTDALAPTFGATAVGGGAVLVPVYDDGSVWKVG